MFASLVTIQRYKCGVFISFIIHISIKIQPVSGTNRRSPGQDATKTTETRRISGGKTRSPGKINLIAGSLRTDIYKWRMDHNN